MTPQHYCRVLELVTYHLTPDASKESVFFLASCLRGLSHDGWENMATDREGKAGAVVS